MHIVHIVGARPNFMKAAPVLVALDRAGHEQTLIHTGQHYDSGMSEVFFDQLGMPRPDVNLGVGSGSHAAQTAQVMDRLEPVIIAQHPDLVLVYGDVNSTLAATLVCAKLLVPIGHVEAGLRSFDATMPEEINRIVTDRLADLLFTPSADGDENLLREGVDPAKIRRVGNVMIDTLVRLLPAARARFSRLRPADRYILVTLHRPSNVDDRENLLSLLEALSMLAEQVPVLFPVHPRTRGRITETGWTARSANLRLTDPLGYIDFLALQLNAALVITDSGGIQEETTFLQIPCITVRPNTERPITTTIGTNVLVGTDLELLKTETARVLDGRSRPGAIPSLWDGHAADRIADHIAVWATSVTSADTRSNDLFTHLTPST